MLWSNDLFAQPYFANQLSWQVNPSPLDLRVGYEGDIQIWRDGNATGDLFSPTYPYNNACYDCFYMYNGIFMTYGNRSIVSYNYGLTAGFQDFWQGGVSDVSGTGTETDPWILSSNYLADGDSRYGMYMEYSYVNGNEFIDVSMTPTVPNNNNREIKVYHVMDTYLGGSDNGPAVVSGTAPYDLVGVAAQDGTVYEAFVVTEDPWDRYCSELFSTALNSPSANRNLSNNLDYNTSTDNAIGVQWTLGRVKGTQPTIKYRIGFTSNIAVLINCEQTIINPRTSRRVVPGN